VAGESGSYCAGAEVSEVSHQTAPLGNALGMAVALLAQGTGSVRKKVGCWL